MKNLVSGKMVNDLLSNLGHKNLLVTPLPIFYWNGNTVTDDETAQIYQVGTLRFSKDFTFSDFLEKNKDKKIVFFSNFSDGRLLNNKNEIRVAVI
jgi:hypothetical protein